MAKTTFLKHFQENLCFCLRDLINDQWEYDSLTVSTEKSNIVETFPGFIDLCITNDQNDSALVAIEIEHLSSYEQSLRNIEKMKTWAHNSNFRKCGFLHILNTYCYLSPD